jgi:nitrogenase iron protein NifH
MKKLAIYGKGGIGKSTVASCLSASLAAAGHRVMQIGCDPKADSTMSLTGGHPPVPVIDYLREHGVCNSLDGIVARGYGGVLCVEAGGPTPGIGCAGRGILAAFEVLKDLGAFELYNPEYVLFDVLGDVVCGGFAAPLREGMADEVIIVSSGEKMSLYAAGTINKALSGFADRGYARLRGIVGNLRGLEGERQRLERFAVDIGTRMLAFIPRDELIGRYEDEGKTIVEGAPDAPLTGLFTDLARSLEAPSESL